MVDQYETKAVKVGNTTLTISKQVGETAGDRLVALLKFIAKWAHAGKPPEGEIDNTLPGDLPGAGGGKPPSVNPPRPGHDLPGSQPEPGHPLPGDQPEISNDLPSWIANNPEAIAKLVLKGCFECNTAQPHKR